MEKTFGSRLKHAWNAFFSRDPTPSALNTGYSYSYRPDRPRLTKGNERSIVNAIYNRIALDVSALDIKHCRVDENGNYVEDMNSKLNRCLTVEANMDQTARAFMQDVVISMLDEGHVAIIPVDTETNPTLSGSYDISTMRTGKILEWRPDTIKVRAYNEKTGLKEDIILPKKIAAIIENPFYSVINEPNSTMQRLIRKLNLLDSIDEQSGAGKLDLIIQLPYIIKTDARREQAEKRRKDIEMQLSGSKYGIAYTDGTERITQLNRPVENNLMKQIEYLTSMLYSQLGITQSVLDGTADEKTMLNYNRTIELFASAIVDEMKRKFLTKTAITQGQSIEFFNDPFKIVPLTNIANIADVFIRNEILTSNEIRGIIGMKPSDDPKADQLLNPNMPHEDPSTMDDIDDMSDEEVADVESNTAEDETVAEDDSNTSEDEVADKMSKELDAAQKILSAFDDEQKAAVQTLLKYSINYTGEEESTNE